MFFLTIAVCHVPISLCFATNFLEKYVTPAGFQCQFCNMDKCQDRSCSFVLMDENNII